MSSVEPLFLPAAKKHETTEQPRDIPCVLCNTSFLAGKTHDCQNLLKHLLVEHKFVIGNFADVAYPAKYLEYWRKRFQGHEGSLTDICAVISTNTGEFDQGEKEHYYLLSQTLPEDAALRKKLSMEKLEAVLRDQEQERSSSLAERMCLFCRKVRERNRAALLNHMASDHNFSVGRPQNLVYVDELLDVLEAKLKTLQCLYCERTFKDWQTLKEHMRKKQHKHINPHNKAYDKYYVVNYVDPSSRSGSEPPVESPDSEDDADPDWRDWEEETDATIVCLFCPDSRPGLDGIVDHMQERHGFDLSSATKGLDFYQRIKLVNFIRKQVHLRVCFVCAAKFESQQELVVHLGNTEHDNDRVDPLCWDQPQYYFPTYENDQLLWALEDVNVAADENCVLPEDVVPVDHQSVLGALTGPE